MSVGAYKLEALPPSRSKTPKGTRRDWRCDLQASALGGGLNGMLAEYAVLEGDGVVKIPEHLSMEEGATLPCAAVTAWEAMMNHAKLMAGCTVLLQGTRRRLDLRPAIRAR